MTYPKVDPSGSSLGREIHFVSRNRLGSTYEQSIYPLRKNRVRVCDHTEFLARGRERLRWPSIVNWCATSHLSGYFISLYYCSVRFIKEHILITKKRGESILSSSVVSILLLLTLTI